VNWKLIIQLSLFGLVMAFATVFVVPPSIEPWVWLAVFAICAYLIARGAPRMHFLHGLLLGVANSVWITVVHVALFDQYLAHHAHEAEMMKSMPLPGRLIMLCVGPIVGVVSGILIGLFAMVAARLVRRGSQGPATA
jgi:hypothetical protein